MHDSRLPVRMVDGVPIVAAPEEIDLNNAPQLRSALLAAVAHGHGTIVADLTRTEFCDSTGLRALLAGHQQARAQGGELLLVTRSPGVLRLLAITSFNRLIPNFATLEEALAPGCSRDREWPAGTANLWR